MSRKISISRDDEKTIEKKSSIIIIFGNGPIIMRNSCIYFSFARFIILI